MTAQSPAGMVRFLPGVQGHWEVDSPWHEQALPTDRPELQTEPVFRADFEADTPGSPPAGWTVIESGEQIGFDSLSGQWEEPRVQGPTGGQVLEVGPGPSGLCRVIPISPLSAYVLTAWIRPGSPGSGLLLSPWKVDPPATTSADELARMFRDPDLHALGQPYLLTSGETANPLGQGVEVEVIERREDGFERWRFEFPAATSFGARSLLMVLVNAVGDSPAPAWQVDELEVHEIPARTGLAWRPGHYLWGLPDPQMVDLEHRTALVRRDWESRRSLLVTPGASVVARLELPAGGGNLETSLCLVEEDRLVRDGPCHQSVQVVLESPGGLAGVDGIAFEQTVELEWQPGQIAAWSEVEFPILAVSRPRTVTLRVEVEGEDRSDSPLVALSTVGFVPTLSGEAPRPPNVVVVSLDTLRFDRIGKPVNGRSLTPNLDALCEQSIVFEQALAPASYTLPSHVSMFTGQRPAVHGLLNPMNVYDPEGSHCFTEQLAGAGYTTAAFTAGAMLNAEYCAMHRGFDRYSEIDPLLSETDPLPQSVPRWYAEDYNRALFEANQMDRKVMPWLEDHVDVPFFLFLHTYLVHNYHPGNPWREQFEVRPEISPADLPPGAGPPAWEWQEPVSASSITDKDPGNPADFVPARDLPFVESLYDGTVARADHAMGQLLDALEGLGLAENTIVIVLSDHGEEFCEHGGLSHARTLYEEMLRVPWILRVPGEAPRRVARAVDLSQLAATVLELTGLDPDPRILAPSALPDPTGTRTTLHEGVLDQRMMVRAARRDRYKLIEHGPRDTLADEDQRALSPQAEQALAEMGYLQGTADLPAEVLWELYDLAKDGAERSNLLGEDELPSPLRSVVLRLRQELAHD